MLHALPLPDVADLPNRQWMMNYVGEIIRSADQGTCFAMLFIDLNEFRNIKYTLGHIFSDELLSAVGARLSSLLTVNDRIARLGYGEFLVIINNAGQVDDARVVAERIVQSLLRPFSMSGTRDHAVSASVGISRFPLDAHEADSLLTCADIAMYTARKANGEVPYAFYQQDLSATIVARYDLEQALRDAIVNNELIVLYQPRVDSASGRLRGMEALVRWHHPLRGVILPQEFIPVAEASGLIVQLGERVIEIVCKQLANWKAQDLPLVPVSVNVSPLQFNRIDLTAKILEQTSKHGIDPPLLEIEVTESCITEQDQVVKQQLAGLSALGMKLLLDDFGTGYSSLSQLQQFKMDVLKVDKSFTANLRAGHRGEALVTAIIAMAHALDMQVTAEGVETIEQLHLLQKLSCNEIQGYLVSAPLDAEAMVCPMRKATLFSEAMFGVMGLPQFGQSDASQGK